MKQNKGFTLIELMMVIVVLGILAAIAVPKYINLTASANTASEQGVVGGVRAGIMIYFVQNKTYPATLDSATNAACSASNACFVTVLQQGGITSQWTKASATSYTGPTGTTYNYTPATGAFQ